MPTQASGARPGDEGGPKGKSGHVTGRIISVTQTLRGPHADVGRSVKRRSSDQQLGIPAPGTQPTTKAQPKGSNIPTRPGTGSSGGGAPTSEDSFEAAPPRRRPQPINAELVKLVASFAPLELAQLKALEQKARLKKAQATAAATAEGLSADVEQLAHAGQAPQVSQPAAESGQAIAVEPMAAAAAAVLPLQHEAHRVRLPLRGHAGIPSAPSLSTAVAAASRPRSRSPPKASHVPAAPAKGAVVKRDLNILPNPVAQKQTEAMQRQAAVSAFVHRLQREQDIVRTEKERRLKAEQDALASQLAEEKEALQAAAAEVTHVPGIKGPPIRRKKGSLGGGTLPGGGLGGGAAGLQGLQPAPPAAEVPAAKKAVDPRPWRQNMRRPKSAAGELVSGETPAGAPRDVAARPATEGPPPRNLSPGAANAKMRTLDPVARTHLKEYMDRKAKDMAAKMQQEKAAQLEAKNAQLKVIKAEMAKARERAQRYAEAAREKSQGSKGPRPAWVDLMPPETGTTPGASRPFPAQRPPQSEPDADIVSERAMPYHMSDAMRMEVLERRQHERPNLSISPNLGRGGRAILVDTFGQAINGEDQSDGPQVVRVHDPEVPEHYGRVYRTGTARPTRPLTSSRPTASQAALRSAQVGQPIAPEVARAIELEARLAARKQYEQHVRELQAAERRDSSRGRDTSRGRDNSRGRPRSPALGRKHVGASLNSRSRSPPKRAKQQSRRARSASRSGSASRRRTRSTSRQPPSLTTGHRESSQVSPRDQPTALQAEMQQARNERQVGDLWDLALQLSARLGVLQQQGLVGAAPPAVQAWQDPQALPDQSAGISLRNSLAGSLLPYPPPVAVVPTGLSAGPPINEEGQGSPSKAYMQQFDESVQADVEFRTEVSWPTSANKKLRMTGISDFATGSGTESSFCGVPGGGAALFGAFSVRSEGQRGSGSTLTSALDVRSIGESAGVLSSGLGSSGTAAIQVQPDLHENSSFGTGCSSGGDQDDPAVPQDERAPADASAAAVSLEREPSISSSQSSPLVPQSNAATAANLATKMVPAAPLIQIPMPSSGGTKKATGRVEPIPALLPYDNAMFSPENPDEDIGSAEELPYGQRVLSIAELHGMLEENPRLTQRMSLDRERDRWEEEGEEPEEMQEPQPHTSSMRIPTRPPQQDGAGSGIDAQSLSSPSLGFDQHDESSGLSDSMGSPPRACEALVTEYESANSPLRLRPAQRELLQVQAAKRAEEQRTELYRRSDPEQARAEEEEPEETQALLLPKSDDPMSIISLIAHKGRLPARPTIIQLSSPPLLEATEQETQTAGEPLGGSGSASAAMPVLASEILLIPKPSGPELVFSRELLQPRRLRSTSQPSSPPKALKESGVGDSRVDVVDSVPAAAQRLQESLPPFVILTAPSPEGTSAQPPGIPSQGGHIRSQASPSSVPVGPVANMPHAQPASVSGAEPSEHPATLHHEQQVVGGAAGAPSLQGVAAAGNGVLGAMASPPPRPRMVTFLDEVQGPPDRVRLAPTELFKQMQDTLKTYEELDAAELELQQLQNARAIAAVQREAHRIARRLDQSAAAETQLQLIAHTQAEMDAKLHVLEENIRNEVRREGLGQLNEVASMFVQQLNRNKVTHVTVQTNTEPTELSRPEIGVQVEPSYSISVHKSSSPPQHHTSLRAGSSPAARTSLRAGSPASQNRAARPSETSTSPGGHAKPLSRSSSPQSGGHTRRGRRSSDTSNEELSQQPGMSGPNQQSVVSIADSIGSELARATGSRSGLSGAGARRHSSVTATGSVSYSSMGGGDQTGRVSGSIQESLPLQQQLSLLSGRRSVRQRSTVETEEMSESSYSSSFEDMDVDDDVEEDSVRESSQANALASSYSATAVESEASELRSGHRGHTTTTLLTQSVGLEEAARASSSQEVQDESDLGASRSSPAVRRARDEREPELPHPVLSQSPLPPEPRSRSEPSAVERSLPLSVCHSVLRRWP